jgi:hypothetical protein
MRCFHSEIDVVASAVLVSVTIAVWTALLPQYAFISFVVAVPYYFLASQLYRPLCEWRWYYYALYATGGAALIFAHIYAWDKAIEYVRLGDMVRTQLVFIPLTAFLCRSDIS